MDSTQLSRQQLDALTLKLAPMLDYLNRLDCRLQQCHFPASDPLATSTREAIEKMQQLLEAVHVLAVTAQESGYFVGSSGSAGRMHGGTNERTARSRTARK